MLGNLRFKVSFQHDHRTFNFDRDIDFHEGLTSITGPNEAGKSLIMEMIRFALWGAEALRGPVSGYKTLSCRLTFTVKGRSLVVERTTSKAKLMEGDEILATGTKPVNAKIIEIFGYDITVFDTANATLQGMVEALGEMRPADRQRMVDKTVGLDFLDALSSWTTEQIKTAKAKVEALESVPQPAPAPPKPEDYAPSEELRNLRTQAQAVVQEIATLEAVRQHVIAKPTAPIEPVRPEDYILSTDLRAEVERLRGLQSEMDRLKGVLSQRPTAPVEPQNPMVGDTLEELRAHEQTRAQLLAEQHELQQRVKGLPIVPEGVTAATLDAIQDQWNMHRAWVSKKALLDKGSFTCPACSTTSPLLHDQLQCMDAVRETPMPTVDEKALGLFRRALEAKDAQTKLKEIIIPASRQSDIEALQKYEAARASYATQLAQFEETERKRAGIQARFDELFALKIDIPSIDAQLDRATRYEIEIQQFQTAKRVYGVQLADYEQNEAKVAQASARLTELVAPDMSAINARYDRSLQYETAFASHEQTANAYLVVTEQLAAEQATYDDFMKSREAVRDTKDKVKAYLVPSLSTAASVLLHKMTGGARSKIEVDEEFDVKADGVLIDVLSGSTKAVSNLALRLGLGQVLTHKVFPVFMGDEIDAAMDTDRAGYTAECLKNLVGEIKQVILISHKRPEADHYIELEAA